MHLRLVALFLWIVLIVPYSYHLQTYAAQQNPAGIVGTYSDIHYIEEAGDVIGTEIKITFSHGVYHGTLEIAQGVPGVPMPISVHVDGRKISFSFSNDDPYVGKFEGEISRGKLRGKFSFKNRYTETVSLPKKSDQSPKAIAAQNVLRAFSV